MTERRDAKAIGDKCSKLAPPIKVYTAQNRNQIDGYLSTASVSDKLPSLHDKEVALVLSDRGSVMLARIGPNGETMWHSVIDDRTLNIEMSLPDDDIGYACVSIEWLRWLQEALKELIDCDAQIIVRSESAEHVWWPTAWFGEEYARAMRLRALYVRRDRVCVALTIVPPFVFDHEFDYTLFGDELTPAAAHRLFQRYTLAHSSWYLFKTRRTKEVTDVTNKMFVIFDDDARWLVRLAWEQNSGEWQHVVIFNVKCVPLETGSLSLPAVVALNKACAGIELMRRNGYFFVRLAQEMKRFSWNHNDAFRLLCRSNPQNNTIEFLDQLSPELAALDAFDNDDRKQKLIFTLPAQVDAAPETAASHWCDLLAPRLYQWALIFAGLLPPYVLLHVIDHMPCYRFVPHTVKIGLINKVYRSVRACQERRQLLDK
jgi:hypothetical protein